MTAGCLDEATVLAFLEGRLPAPARADVEGHLASCVSCTDLTTWAAAEIVNRSRGTLGEERPFFDELAPGATVGQYQILGSVGRGGMGEVYAAYHPELDRRIALKVVHEAGTETEERRARTLREARAIARLTHPNVVTVYDAGVAGDMVFIAMEFIDGVTLGEWLRAAPRSARQILDVFVAAGRGLAAAHAAEIIHRDFKPENVMIGNDGSVRVMDFGLARLVYEDLGPVAGSRAGGAEAKAPANASVTRTGALLGTPAYMAPEQFRCEPATARSDQFSFCVALHEALYGVRPALAHLQSNGAAPPSTADASKPPRRGGTPQWLRNLVLRGLSTDPAARWGSMDELTRALARDPVRNRRRWLVGAVAALVAAGAAIGLRRASHSTAVLCQSGPAHLADTWTGAGASSGPGRRAALRTAFLATGVPGAADTWDRVASLLDRYAAGWLRMYRDSCEATHARGEQSSEVLDLRTACLEERHAALKALTDVFASADRQSVSKGVDAVNALPALDRCADVRLLRAAVEPPRDSLTRARVDDLRRRAAVAKALFDSGRNPQALEQGHDLVAEARTVGYAPLLAELLAMVGAFEQGPLFGEDTVGILEEAVWTAIRARRDDIAAEAASQLIGMVGYLQHQPKDGERWANLAEALLNRMGEGHELIRAWVLTNRASLLVGSDPGAALRLSERSLALKRKVLPADHPDIALSLQSIAEARHQMGDDARALEDIRQAQESFARAYGPSSAFVAECLNNRGESLVALDRPAEALPMFRDSLSRFESELGPDRPLLGYPLTGLGRALLVLGRPNEARAPLERALQIRQAHEPDPALRAETRFALAQALWATGEHRRAVDMATTGRREYAKVTAGGRAETEVAAWLAGHE